MLDQEIFEWTSYEQEANTECYYGVSLKKGFGPFEAGESFDEVDVYYHDREIEFYRNSEPNKVHTFQLVLSCGKEVL